MAPTTNELEAAFVIERSANLGRAMRSSTRVPAVPINEVTPVVRLIEYTLALKLRSEAYKSPFSAKAKPVGLVMPVLRIELPVNERVLIV